MISAEHPDTRWLDESRALSLLGLPRSTFHGWAKAELIEQDPGGAYTERLVLELAVLAALRDHFSVDELRIRWPRLRRQGKVDEFVARARALDDDGRYDVIVELQHGGVAVASTDEELACAVRTRVGAKHLIVLDLADRIRAVREGFDNWATSGPRPTKRKPGRPARRAEIRHLHSA